ncbi:MAG TPA: 2OG-Fe(II) oxygenase family protein, partial [Caulobacteraceae bacterium]
YCDVMATRYLPGHFLTAHDDHADGQDRLFAYVLNLTGRWRADWGGMLLFLDEEDHVAEGYMPAFNSLNIFRVPQRHAVALVAPYADGPRLAITGWIRSVRPERWEPYDQGG